MYRREGTLRFYRPGCAAVGRPADDGLPRVRRVARSERENPRRGGPSTAPETTNTGNQRAVSDDASCSTLYASCGAGMRPPGAPLLVRRLTGYWRTVVASSPLRFGVERRWRSCAHPPHLPSAAAAEDQLRAHQARGEGRRFLALFFRPPARPSPGSPPACARSATAATRPPAASTPPATSSAARRRRRGAAALCRPALLDGAAQPLQHAAVARALLLDPVVPALLRARAPVLRLRTRGAAQGPGRGAARGAADGREPKAGGEGGEDQESRRGRGCGACMRR